MGEKKKEKKDKEKKEEKKEEKATVRSAPDGSDNYALSCPTMYWCVTSELGDRQAVVIVIVLIVKTLQLSQDIVHCSRCALR